MSTLELFAATGTTTIAEPTGSAHWPHLNSTGTMVQVPRQECDLAGMDANSVPEAARLVSRIQEALGPTIGQIARALGCSRQAVHGWMRGKRIEVGNLGNLTAFAEISEEWSRAGKERPSSIAWSDELLQNLANAGIATEKGREYWRQFIANQEASLRRRSRIPVGTALNALLGSGQSGALERSHRLSDNLRSMRRHGR